MFVFEVILGFLLLILGGELIVRFAVRLASRLGLSPLLMGLTVVAMGGSMPELVTSVEAALLDSPGISLGNVIGSNIANSLLILGTAAVIAPVIVTRFQIQRDGTVMLVFTVLTVIMVLLDALTRTAGILLLGALCVYIYWAYRSDESGGENEESDDLEGKNGSLAFGLLMIVLALAILILGARLAISGAVDLARHFDVSETVIGLTVIAIGTSLPELVTSVVAARKKQSAIVIGNVIGSNIYNIAGILGVTILISPFDVPVDFSILDITVFAIATVVILIFAATRHGVSRLEGLALIAAYGGFLWLLVTNGW